MLRFAVAPSGFKECLAADGVAAAIRTGIRRVVPGAIVDTIPLIDGGEGSARLLARSTGGELVPTTVTGPVGEPVEAHYALLDERTAFVEMAAAAGLSLVPPGQRDPGATTSRGVGELISAALDADVEKIIVGCGDSGICDGGAGALRALGVRVLDVDGAEIGEGGAELLHARHLDVSGLDPRVSKVDIVVAVNPENVLCGPNGVARRYGPQKGASPEQVEQLAAAMQIWADLLRKHSGVRYAELSGSGASGGLGAGLAGVLGAKLESRFDVFLESADLDRRLEKADLVITAEGAIDASTALGKIPAEVARRAKRHSRPVIALCGTIGPGADISYDHGIDAITGILTGPVALEDAINRAPELIADATARSLRMLLLGRTLRAA
ncbi:glycerate kinase [Saccharopolyspora antimicrobica]|uniref:Glycerate kinase n=1 Tax=Saccharopolyspora antimicrobica TaxID=455193 RepID=A0A1I4X4G1_9PSEU|nr:glycerate kinase [Saccharopolyspora antimicrobica]RKT84319.1 glycerate kinase [Saccharopolyspora antimicrobica]SFN20928.1 glycerate kinase [Saccharopolyspora antimicrobica]